MSETIAGVTLPDTALTRDITEHIATRRAICSSITRVGSSCSALSRSLA